MTFDLVRGTGVGDRVGDAEEKRSLFRYLGRGTGVGDLGGDAEERRSLFWDLGFRLGLRGCGMGGVT